MQITTAVKDEILPCNNVPTRNWYAWEDQMPPRPYSINVTGEVEAPNPGVIAILSPTVPPCLNPTILCLDLVLVQRPGGWPRVITWVPARYSQVLAENESYKEVHILCDGQVIQQLKVNIIV